MVLLGEIECSKVKRSKEDAKSTFFIGKEVEADPKAIFY